MIIFKVLNYADWCVHRTAMRLREPNRYEPYRLHRLWKNEKIVLNAEGSRVITRRQQEQRWESLSSDKERDKELARLEATYGTREQMEYAVSLKPTVN